MNVVTREDKIILLNICTYKGSREMVTIVDVMKKNRLRWLGKVLRREEMCVVRVVKVAYFEGKWV